MNERGRSTLPTPLGELLESNISERHEDRLWARIAARRRPSATDARGELPLPLARALVSTEHDPATRVKHWRAIHARRGAAPKPADRTKFLVGTLVGSGLAAAVVAMLLVFAPRDVAREQVVAASALLLSSGAPLQPVEAEQADVELVLTDASRIRLAAGARLVPLVSTASRVDLALERGSALFSVTPGGPRRWSVAAGAVRVEVVGTEFRVSRASGQVEVQVAHGIVLVSGQTVPGGAQRLTAGDQLRVESSAVASAPQVLPPAPVIPEVTAQIAPPVEVAPTPLESPVDDPLASVSARSPRKKRPGSHSGGPNWSSLSAGSEADAKWRLELGEGRYDAAYRALGSAQFAHATRLARSAEELLDLADVARLSGHARDAVIPLKRLLDDFSDSPHAAVAAFTLGRTLLDQMHDATGAAQAFQRAIGLRPPHALLEDCHARLVQAQLQAGARDEAQRAADKYRMLFPNGRHLAELERWLQSE
ncbi:MAG: FecR domain-containing protein [Myxococcales bacterium]